MEAAGVEPALVLQTRKLLTLRTDKKDKTDTSPITAYKMHTKHLGACDLSRGCTCGSRSAADGWSVSHCPAHQRQSRTLHPASKLETTTAAAIAANGNLLIAGHALDIEMQ